MRVLLRPLWLLLALLLLAEAWAWDRLGPVAVRLAAMLPLRRIKEAAASAIARLPPVLTLLVFAVPGLVLVPFKLLGLWLLAHGHAVLGIATFLAAKTVGLGLTAFLFEVCRPKLMRLAWFARLYAWVLRARAWARLQLEPALVRVRSATRAARAALAAALPPGHLRLRVAALRRRIRRRLARPA